MPQQRMSDFKVDHRVIVVEPTLTMFTIAKEIAALQAKYNKLEEVEQRRQFRAFKEMIRSKAANETMDAIEKGP